MPRASAQALPRNVVRRGEVYYGRVTIGGKTIQQSLETADLIEARRRIGPWLVKVRATSPGSGPSTLHAALEVFAARHSRQIAASTRTRYAVSADHLLRLIGPETRLDRIDRAILSSFAHKRAEEGASNPTVRRDLAFLSIVYEIAADAGFDGINPVTRYLREAKRRGLAEHPPRDRYLSHEEEETLLATIDVVPTPAHRKLMTKAFVILSIDTGLRHEEMLSLEWANVDLRRKELYVPKERAKSGVGRRVPLLPRALDLLRVFPRNKLGTHVLHHKDGRRFGPDAMWRPLKAVTARCGIPDLTVHDLRRTCGCRLLQDHGLSMSHVSKWLGHATSAITERHYAFLRVDDLHRAVSKSVGAGYGNESNLEIEGVRASPQLIELTTVSLGTTAEQED